MADRFYGVTPQEVRQIVYEYVAFNSFLKNSKVASLRGNSTTSVRKAKVISLNRITPFNREKVGKFYNQLMSKTNSPLDQMYNVYETRIYACSRSWNHCCYGR